MGQMGEQQATSPEVKQFAQKLHEDHQRLDDKLTQTAQAAGITLEGKGFQDEQKSAQKEMQKLQGKTGHDFDKAFVSMMVKDHEKDIKDDAEGREGGEEAEPGRARRAAQPGGHGMQGHLATAKQLEKSVAKGGKSASGSSSSSTGSGSSGSSGSTGGTTGTGTAAGDTDSRLAEHDRHGQHERHVEVEGPGQ